MGWTVFFLPWVWALRGWHRLNVFQVLNGTSLGSCSAVGALWGPYTARQIYITAKTQITLGPPHRGMRIYGLTPALSDHFPPHRVENQ
jgi:hypothetical protein